MLACGDQKTVIPVWTKFTIERRMPFGDNSVFVEIKFKARLYKTVSEYVDINDGHFKGFFYRRDK